MIIDAENLILGRLASKVAKKALLGEKIDIINCEKAVVLGNKRVIQDKYKRIDTIGTPRWGPFQPKRADMFVKKTIRGMLPYKQEKGRKAFERIKCYQGIPDKFKNEKTESFDDINASKKQKIKFLTVKQITQHLGRKYD